MAADETCALFSGSGFTAARIQPSNYVPVDGDWAFVIGSDAAGIYETLKVGDLAGVKRSLLATPITLMDFAIAMRQTEASTPASVRGLLVTYPTGFVGNENLVYTIDGGSVQETTFQSIDQTLDDVVDRINALIVGAVAIADNGQLRLTSLTTGTSSEIDIISGTSLSALGLSVATHNGEHITYRMVVEVDGTEVFSLQPDAGNSVQYVTRTVNLYDVTGVVEARFYLEAVA